MFDLLILDNDSLDSTIQIADLPELKQALEKFQGILKHQLRTPIAPETFAPMYKSILDIIKIINPKQNRETILQEIEQSSQNYINRFYN